MRLRRIIALWKEVSTSHARDSSQGIQREGYGKYRDQRLSQRAAVDSAIIQRAYIVALLLGEDIDMGETRRIDREGGY